MERLRCLAAEPGLDVTKLLDSLGKLSDDEVRNVLKNLSAASGLVEEMGKGHGKK